MNWRKKRKISIKWLQMKMDFFFEEDLMNGARPIERRYQLYWNRWMLLSYEDESRDSAVEVEVKDGLGIARLAER